MSNVTIKCPFDDEVLWRVTYGCTCGTNQPISKLYFCRHCLAPRCSFCVSHEVDSHYCPNCLENMPSAEARVKKNRCANCFDCPSCGHTLSTRATSAQIPAADDPANVVTKKVYYLNCPFCRWTSRDIGLQDQTVASGGWPDLENPNISNLALLRDHYRALAQREKLEKESKRYMGRKYYSTLNPTIARVRSVVAANQESSAINAGKDADGNEKMSPAVAKDISEVEVLPDDIFEKEIDLCTVTTLQQRFGQLDFQPESVKSLYPKHKHLMIKRSQRCRKCEHNLCKPEYNPSSIKFKIQLAAFFHIPEIVIFKIDSLKAGEVCRFVLKIVNPTQHPTQVDFVSEEKYEEYLQMKKKKEESDSRDDKKKINVLRNPSLVIASDNHKVHPNAAFELPKTNGGIFLPQRDDAAEFDESGPDLKGIVDDKKLVLWRKCNKAGIALSAKLNPDIEKDQKVITRFGMKFVYTNTISAIDQKEIQTAEIIIPVNIDLGTII